MRSEDAYGRERCELLAMYMIETGDTVRAAAARFGISKSTVHKDITEKLARKNPAMYKDVKSVLDRNKSERHLRGGEATKQKYQQLRDMANVPPMRSS
ncbi:MAG: stage III sporulation protein D [Ruminococcaceae bacterium]|nr:stage III sporulation protein D [Oscillospiraceae bacterium]